MLATTAKMRTYIVWLLRVLQTLKMSKKAVKNYTLKGQRHMTIIQIQQKTYLKIPWKINFAKGQGKL